MAAAQSSDASSAPRKRFQFPTAFTILFILIALVAIATHIVPAGQYATEFSEALGEDLKPVLEKLLVK